jgi:hypothetical protein
MNAARTIGEALYVIDLAISAEYSISARETTDASDVNLITSIVLDNKSGSTLRTACGRMT